MKHKVKKGTARRSNQSILKEISPGISLEGMMLKLKLQYFGHLMRRVDSLDALALHSGAETQEGRSTTIGWASLMSPPLVVPSLGPCQETKTSSKMGLCTCLARLTSTHQPTFHPSVTRDWCWSWSSNTFATWSEEPDAGRDWRQKEKKVGRGWDR